MKQSMRNNTVRIFALIAFVALFGGCKVDPEQTLPDRSYELVWSDEFNGDSGTLVDASKWAYDLGNSGWGNNELQNYTNSANNISMDGKGNLAINVLKDASGNYSSARIKTDSLFAQKFGRIEARIKTPTGAGIWPAFWMLGSNIDKVSWPECGEIDIMEQRGQQSNITYSTLHGPGYSGAQGVSAAYGLKNARFDSDFYVYAVEWGENYIDFFVNNYLFKRLNPADVKGEWVYNQPFFLIMNVAVGGNFLGPPNSSTPFPGAMKIDYVRVYKEK
jgi:beta-glucanase (GH16 family)